MPRVNNLRASDDRSDELREVIKGRQARYKYSDSEMAEALGISLRTYQRAMANPMSLSFDNLYKLSKKLRFTIKIQVPNNEESMTWAQD